MDALIYGESPSITTEKLSMAPPVRAANTPTAPEPPRESRNCLSANGSAPGTAMCATIRYMRSNHSVMRMRRRSSSDCQSCLRYRNIMNDRTQEKGRAYRAIVSLLTLHCQSEEVVTMPPALDTASHAFAEAASTVSVYFLVTSPRASNLMGFFVRTTQALRRASWS